MDPRTGSRHGRSPPRRLLLTALAGSGAPVVRAESWRSLARPVPNVALDSAVIRAVSGSEQMVTQHADHQYNASTFAARVTAATLSETVARVVTAEKRIYPNVDLYSAGSRAGRLTSWSSTPTTGSSAPGRSTPGPPAPLTWPSINASRATSGR